jgi:hypothetical protein
MRKSKKSSAGNKRRQKENGQARLRTEPTIRREGSNPLSRMHEAKLYESTSPPSPSGRKPQRDEAERKRKLWERKQAELEARWLTAQSRQTEENAARKRTMKIAFSISGTVFVALLCALAWYFA